MNAAECGQHTRRCGFVQDRTRAPREFRVFVLRSFSICDTNIGKEIMGDQRPLQPIEDLNGVVRANEDIHLSRPCVVTINFAAVGQ